MQRRALLKLAALSTIGLARAQAAAGPSPSIHNTEPFTMNDVIIVGGSFAGLAAALQLGRAHRKVTVLDTGLPRNRFAGHFPTEDAPETLLALLELFLQTSART